MKINFKILIGIILGIILIGFFLYKYHQSQINVYKQDIDKYKKEIISRDTLEKIREGEYRKLVNSYNDEKSLTEKLKNTSVALQKDITNKKEKPVLIGKTTITIKDGKTEETPLIEEKDSTYSFVSKYPTTKPFVVYNGNVNFKKKTVKGDLTFKGLDLTVVVTEKPNGMWDSYVVGDPLINISDLEVNTLPKIVEKPKKQALIKGYGGLGVIKLQNKVHPTVNIGAVIGRDNKIMISGYASPISNDVVVGGGIMVKF